MSAARRPAALAVLEEAERVMNGWSCESTAECCRFGETNREPYLTEAEWRVLEAEVARQGRRVPAPREDRVCPFLEGGRCSVYRARPLGCRTFYCHRADGPKVPRRVLVDLPRRLEVMSEDPDAPGKPLTTWLNRARRPPSP